MKSIKTILKIFIDETKNGIIKQFFKFSFVGVLNTVVTFVFILFFYLVLKVNYFISNVVGYVAGFINSFVFNKIWTFNKKNKEGVLKESFLFILVFGISYLVQLFILKVCLSVFLFSLVTSQIIAMFGYTAVNFLGNKFITFK